jgi:hypothetical protein
VSLVISGTPGWDTLRAELLDPVSDGNDALDPTSQPAYVPSGYSTSNNLDGLSFAQDSALARSAVFAGGSGTVIADEMTDMGDILRFAGLGSGMVHVACAITGATDSCFASMRTGTRHPNRLRCFCLAPDSPGSQRIVAVEPRTASRWRVL